MSVRTRAGSTKFQVTPSTLSAVPTMQPSAIASTSATVSARTPVLAKTGTSPAVSFAARNSASGAGDPVIGPETQSASGSDEKATERATAAISRGATGAANSALIVKKSRTLVASM